MRSAWLKKIFPLGVFCILLNSFVILLSMMDPPIGSNVRTYAVRMNLDMMIFWMIPGYMLLTPLTVPLKSYFFGWILHYMFEAVFGRFWTIKKETILCIILSLIFTPLLLLDYTGVFY